MDGVVVTGKCVGEKCPNMFTYCCSARQSNLHQCKLKSDWVKGSRSPYTNRQFRRRSSQPISCLGTEKL